MNRHSIIGFVAGVLLSSAALAQPNLILKVTAEREITVEENGKTVTKRVAVSEAEPGHTIIYTLSYNNTGTSSATNVELKDKIPNSTTYVADSVFGENADISFSIDDAKTFKQPSVLVYETKDENGNTQKSVVTPDKYTHIRWVVKEVAAGQQGSVGYRALID